ncbi:protein dispatched homolog 1-like [Glandiceps talaboti]
MADDKAQHKEPLAWCRLIVNRPKTTFAVTLSFVLSFPVVTIILILCGQTVFPTVFNDLPLQLTDEDLWLRAVAWKARDKQFTKYSHNVGTSEESGIRSTMHHNIHIFYENTDGNVFTKESLQAIRDLEDELISKPNYTDYCQLDTQGDCVKPISIVRYFDGTYSALGSVFNDPSFDNIPAVLYAAISSPFLKSAFYYHLGKDALIDGTNDKAESSITRSIIPMGFPLEGYSTDEEMENAQADFITTTYNSHFRDLFSKGYRNLAITYSSKPLWQAHLDTQITYDTILVAGSFAFIFGFLWFQTGSLWIAGFAVLGIMTSFFGANLFYRYVLDYRFFGTFHILSIFIILGIGADDIFVFMDTWRSTGFEIYPGLEYRLSDAYRRASVTMLITSLTTAVAFFVNATSPLLGVKSFGIFAGILVLVNYLTVIIFLPTVVITYHNSWRNCIWCCCRPFQKSAHLPEKRDELRVDSTTPQNQKRALVRFFMGPYFRFVTHKVWRWIILLFFVVAITIFSYFVTKLRPQEEEVQVFEDGNNFVQFKRKMLNAFKSSSLQKSTVVYIVWGLQNQDLSSCHHTDYECTGDTVWDNTFDLNPTLSQEAMKNFCTRIRNLTVEESERLHIRRDIVTGEVEVKCFINDMYEFYEYLDLVDYPNNTDLSMPINEAKMRTLMEVNPTIFDTSKLHKTFYRYFETGLGYWLTNGYTGIVNGDNNEFMDVIGEEPDERDMTKMPPSVSNAFQCTSVGINLFHFLKVQKTLSDSAIKGVVLGISLAFPLLVMTTTNIVLGAMATISIAATTWCVIAVIPMAGWKLGLLESLNLSLIVGLAVDYVVHLAEGYRLSPKEDRFGRLNDTLEHVGISVVSGAATTLGASAFMLFAKIMFFKQFAIFMFCTIGFSLIFSLGLFTTVLGLMGPQGETGSLKVFYYWIIGRKKTDVECKYCNGKGFHGNHQTVRIPMNGSLTQTIHYEICNMETSL